MTLRDWLELAETDPQAAAVAWPTLNAADKKTLRAAVAKAQQAEGLLAEPLRELGRRLGQVMEDAALDAVIDSWPTVGALSEHLELELSASQRLGRPLASDEAVPGCGCPECTGIPADHPIRVGAQQRLRAQLANAKAARRQANAARLADREQEWEEVKARARSVGIVVIAERLGLGPVEGRGKQVRVRCPFHDDEHPSLHLSTEKNLWYCPVCAEGGDGVKLYMRAKQVSFATAVQDLTC